ncbi:alpha-aspartyl dipeptidase. Serine peptidase. MEROPS family S51 [Colwellia chukchiensis]|uniref:Alpha-aspartyl dipeptidase. Serine peptidase. MEROPS family S51 n=1 Tax=Colwellia chukchiensis TaxID=641665 RepID=A0A1H7MTJ1_9GAMM|nr:dipeptidase PepE [Colwellia chukchiensis]SEL14686.1 alpha-aspartyl dipeptidase. Serine peptidase. MEROPS family S51 [Colwellia chukchiensis]
MTIENANLLLLSSSRVGETAYLQHALAMIEAKLKGIKELLFIPYAGVTLNNDQYTAMVQSALTELGIKVHGIHKYDNQVNAIEQAQAIAVGGGNTFHLLHQLYQYNLIEPIQAKVAQGMPYIGWSAGSNIAGLSIRTTNDMPIIAPPSFDALQLVNFQLNPHYTDYQPPGHNGETRAQRLAEFMVLNPTTPIVAIVEGTGLDIQENRLKLVASSADQAYGYLFKAGDKLKFTTNEKLDHLL